MHWQGQIEKHGHSTQASLLMRLSPANRHRAKTSLERDVLGPRKAPMEGSVLFGQIWRPKAASPVEIRTFWGPGGSESLGKKSDILGR